MKLLIYGCGNNCKRLIEYNMIDINDVCFFCDMKKDFFFGKKVLRIEELSDVWSQIDYCLVTIKDFSINKSVYCKMKELGYPLEKVLFIYNTKMTISRETIHEQNDLLVRDLSLQLFDSEVCVQNSKRAIATCLYDYIDKDKIIGNGDLIHDEMYIEDYIRYRTFELIADEIKNTFPTPSNYACAELGVYQGEFAALINRKFPEMKLYLYDSFESFIPAEFLKEKQSGYAPSGFLKGFKNTSVEQVLSIMKYPQNCIFRPGYFPDSIQEDDKKEKFIFVSLDVDFEDSTYNGLIFFWPRLVEGGYIFLHDYHNHCLFGVKKAIERFEHDNSISLNKLPLCDSGGTLIIIK